MMSAQRKNVERYLEAKRRKRRPAFDGKKISCESCDCKKNLEWHHKLL